MGDAVAAEKRPFERPHTDHRVLGLVVHGTGEQPHGDMLRHAAREFLPLIRDRIDDKASIAAKPLDEGEPAEVWIWFRYLGEMYELRFLEVWWSHAFERIPLGPFIAGLWRFFWTWRGREDRRPRPAGKPGLTWREDRRSWVGLLYRLLRSIIMHVTISVLAACAILPMLFATLAVCARLPGVLPEGAAEWLRRTQERLANFVMYGQATIVELVVIVVSPGLVLLLLLLWLLESPPAKLLAPKWLLDAHRSLVNLLTRQLGDMWVYLLQPWEASQIRSRFEERFHQVVGLLDGPPDGTKVEAVFVIAYSMGSVVAYEALTGQRMVDLIQTKFPVQGPPTFHFISVGSALNPAWDFVPEDERFRFYRDLPSNVRWLNVWADYDPVARGKLRPPTDIGNCPSSHQVTNQMDLFRDHFVYWNNAEEVIAKILAKILETVTFPSLQDKDKLNLQGKLKMNVRARHMRVSVLTALKAVAWLVLPAVYFLLVVTGWGQWISGWVDHTGGWVDETFLDDKTWRRYALSPALWAAVAAAVTAVVYSTMVKWVWDYCDGRHKYDPPEDETR